MELGYILTGILIFLILGFMICLTAIIYCIVIAIISHTKYKHLLEGDDFDDEL